MKLKIVDLFCGCGGMSLGFQNAGFIITHAFDNWDKTINIYNSNFKSHKAIMKDLGDQIPKTVKEIKQSIPDMIIGGPPCQDFSSAGKRDEDLGRGDLTIAFAEIVINSGVRWFVMENVDRIIKTKKYREVVKSFKKAGYGLSEKILDASLCGVPQIRKRFFLIGHKGAENGFLDYYLNKNLSLKPMTLRDYFGEKLETEYYYRHPRNYSRRAVYSIDEPSPTVRGVNRPIPKGYPGHPADATRDMKVVRPLTTLERAAIQTFPPSYQFEGTKTDLEQIIGNAVPVRLAEYVANCISEYINDCAKSKQKKTRIEGNGQYALAI